MSRYLSVEPVCRLWRMLLAGAFLLFNLGAAQGATLVQDFYLPMPEAQISQANSSIVSGSAGNINSTFSILVTGDNTVIYYDQWEDGYETDLSNPTQSTTQIWGDGNDAHGIPPGFAHNPQGLPAGTVITLTNNVTLPRNPSQILWDARDHIAATKALVITRAAWPTSIGPVFAGAVGVLSTLDYGTNYISPVGQNLTNHLFKYVGMFVMAAQDNTSVLIDPNGNGVGTTNVVLNQGESYLVNGGIMKGGRVTATKPVQADLVIGDTSSSYASDWFTLYPVQEWSSSYYTPVSSAATQNQPAYVYLFNPNTNSILINYGTLSGSGSFSVPASNGVVQFQMPVASGAGFTNAAGENFFAICTVAANPQNDTAYNWGFTLVPGAALTTQADVGWGPGSAQTNVDGSPVWVTAVSSTTVYVSYNGGTNGAFIDPNGNHYDTNFTLSTLQAQKVYSPTKTQTGMKLYTLNGALITAAWGEDADVAAAGNPYIDAGTTVLPFPVPLLNKVATIVTDVPPTGLSLGDTILYSVQINNAGLLPLGNTLVIDVPTANLQYVTNSTTYNGTSIPDNTSGQPFPLSSPGFTVPVILSQGTSTFTYMAKVIAAGSVSNSVNIGGTAIFAQAYLPPAITNGASVTVNFTDTNGVPLGLYTAGANVYVTLTNTVADSASNITVTVQDLTHGDVENIVLTETGATNNIFRNIKGLPTSTTAGLLPQDGTLNVTPGDTLSVSYTDPTYGDSASNTATIQIPALTKQLYLSVNNSTNGTQDLNRIDPVAYGHGPIHTSIDIGTGGGGGGIGVAASNSISASTGTTVTVPLNVGSGNNRLLLVGLSGRGITNTAVTFNGVNLSLVGVSSNNTVTPFPQIAIWSMINPPAISNNVVAQFTGSLASGVIVGAVVFTNVNQTTPLGTFVAVNNAATTTEPTITISSATNQMVFDTYEYDSSTVSAPGAGQTAVFNLFPGPANNVGGGSVRTGATSVTNTWSNATTGHHWAIGAVSILPATGGGVGGPSTNVTSFVQTPVFCSSFVMPSNNFVTITNYITVTNGVMPANPAVTATLQYNGVNFLTLTNPAYSASASNLIWSAVLSSNVTVPVGQAITCVISNGQPNTSFHINYDSTNAQSKITLPASGSTVIAIDTFAVYDAPYPGGNLVTTPTAGSTLYVRATVSDPFGSYDVTGLGLAITAPSPGANLTTNLSATNIVADDGCTRTYEFPWPTGPTTGNFNIAATAHEGTEGITATAATSVSPITLDLGTPNSTGFTSGNDGPATNTYPGGTNGFVCVLVQDLAANTNPAAIQTVAVTVTSSAGDSEIVTLTETSTNTGIFTGCINTSTNGPDVPNDGVLYAPVGSLLTASYTDAIYPSQTSSANATILPVAGVSGVKITKTIVSPTGGQVGLGLPVEFNLQVINTGSTTLTNVVVTDNFASASLSYSSASLTPTTVTGSSLTWANVGNLTPGQSTNITVTFTALTTGVTTNSATANGITATNSSSVSLLVSHSALNITKILLSPTNSPVAVGSNVVFRILIQNVGNTVIPTLPLEDNFSGAYFQFVSATIPPNGSGYGSLVWTNLASPVPLATNAIITNDVTMTVVGQGSPANNTAVADYAVDIYGNAVPTATGSTNIATAAATISGYVYNDKDQSGTLTAGDTPLSGVTIQIYTDPTGTGTPGTLVLETTTSSGGYYELDNLMLGQYVVVETDLPGFGNTVPANGRLKFNLTTLTTSSNNYFLQYQPSSSSYSTWSGRVIDDVLGTASNTNQPGLANVTVNLVDDVNSNGVADPGEPVIYSATTDANGVYSFSGIVPGHYVIQEIDLYGYYSSGDSQPPNNNQISFVTTNSVTSTTNFFYERLLPTAIPDTSSGFYLVPLTIYPLTNDLSPNGDLLNISNAFTTNGILVINPGATNLTFTPTNVGADTIIYTNADAHGGTSTAVITVNVTALADLAVGKSAPPTVLADSNLIYTISVTNLGPSGAASVVVTDSVPTGVSFVSASSGGTDNSGVVSWNLGNLAVGAVSNVTLTVLASASGSITNVATGGSPTPDPALTNNTSPPVATTVTPQADLSVGKTGLASVLAASNLIYSISVTNFGPSTAGGVLVTDTLPVGVTFVSASGGGVANSGVVTWNFGNLPNGSVSNVTLTVLAPASGSLTNIATVGSPTGDPNLTNNTTPPVTTTVTPLADLTISKTGPSTVFAASNLSYTISVTNFGPSSASSVVVTDTLPVGVTFASASGGGANNSGVVNWNLGTLAAGQVSNLTVTVTAPASGTLTNVASVASPTGDTNLLNNATPPVITTVTPVADAAIAKAGPASAFAASNLSYTISVTNFGPSSASSIVVTDTLPVGVTFVSASGGGANISGVVNWNLGTLTAGQVSNLTVTVTAPASGSLTNVANVNSPTGDPNLTNNVTPPVVTTVTPVADVAIAKIGPASVFAASNLSYTISVTNFGPSSASSVVVTDTLPAGVTFVSANGGGAINSGVVNWSLGTLAAGQVSNLTVTVTAPASGSLTNVANLNSPTGDPNLTNNVTPPVVTTVTPVADVAIAKIGPASVFAASNLSYTISVTNFGPSSASSIVVTDTLPTGVTFVNASGGGAINSGAVNWNLGTLTAGQVSNLTVTVTAPASGSLTNVANVNSPTGDPNLTNNVAPPVVTSVTPVADVTIAKTAPPFVLAAGGINYTISVTNLGPSSAGSVVVTDTLPAGVTFVSASGGGANNSGVVNWSLGTLAAGQVSNLTVTVTAPASGSLTNIASVASPTGDPNLTNNVTPPVVTTVSVLADLAVGKSAPATVLAASNLTYTISVTNFGPSAASSVTVTDAVPAGAAFVSASGGGANNSGVVTWNLGNLASAAISNLTLTVLAPAGGSMTNIATVGSPTGDPNFTNNASPPVATTVIPLADLTIAKTGPAAVFAASNFSYTISVTNLGPSGASGVVVTDTLPLGVTFVSASGNGTNNSGVVNWSLGALAAGQTSNLTVTVTSPASGSLTNVASVSSPTGDPNLTNNVTPPVVTTVTPLADISVVKTGPARMTFNTNFSYTLTVSNAGPSTAAGVMVTDSLPAGLVFVGSVPAASTNPVNQVIWSLGNFAAGAGSNLTLTVLSTQRGSLTNLASGGSPTFDPVPTNNLAPPVVTAVTNIPPIALPDNYAMAENTTNTFAPLINDIVENPGGYLTLVSVNPANGVATIINNTNVIFTPTNNFLGFTVIGYTITDNVGGTNSSLITVLVTNVPPVANPDSYSMTENSTNTFAPLVNDLVETPGGFLTIVSVAATNGVAGIVNGTNVVFTPTNNFRGTATIGYTITDNVGGTSSSTISVLVTNIPPIANPDSYTMAENTTNTLTPLVNDLVETPGGVLQIIGVSPTNGTATFPSLTNVVFVPTPGFVGIATIGYMITDGIGGTNSSLITVNVTNLPPTAFGQSVSTTENTALPIALTGFDPAGHALTFIIASGPSGGTLTALNTNTGAVTYTPTNNFTGADTFTFHVNNGYNNSSNATVTIAVTPVADLLVAQSGPASGVAGADLTFTVAVTNLGPAGSTNIIITNQLAAGFTFVSASDSGATNGNDQVIWTVPVLPANGATNLTVMVFAVQGGIYTNIASGISITPDLNPTNNDGSLTNAQAVTTISGLADVAVFKTGTTSVLAGGTVNYAITATNFGPSTASNVVVSDNLPPGVTLQSASGNYSVSNGVIVWAAAVLPDGAATNFTVTVTAPFGGILTNIASSTSDTADPNPGNNDGSSPSSVVITPVTTVADLAIGKSAAASISATSNLVYTLSVTNFGPSTASGVTVTDAVPAGATFVSASAGGANSFGVVIWSLGGLSSGMVSNLTLTVAAPASGTLTNVATVGSPTGDPNLTNNVTPPVITTITPQADLQIGKAAAASVLATSNLVYTISVTNFGPSTASGVIVTDAVPVGTSFVSASNGGVDAAGVVTWNLGNLPSNAVSSVTLTVTAPTSGTLTNIATVGSPTGDPNLTNNVTPPVVSTVTPQADLQIGKTAAASVLATSNLVYTISVTNFGPSVASSVIVTDAVPVGTTFVSASNGGVDNAGTVTWNLSNLASNVVSSVTLTVTAPASGTLTNVATVGSPTGDPNLTNNVTPPVTTTVTPQADLQIGKTAAASVLATSNLVYTISVTNFGPSTASSVVVTDTVPVGTTFVSASSGGVNNAGVVTWSLGNLASNAVSSVTLTVTAPTSGMLTNIATVGSPIGDPNLTNNVTPPVITTVTPQADLQIGKTAAASVLATSNLVYAISVTNFGPSIASSVIVTDAVPVGTTFVSASNGGVDTAGVVTWNLGNLASNAVSSVSLTVAAPTSGTLTNIATVGSPTGDPNLTNNVTPPVLTTVTPVADVAIGKSGPGGATFNTNFSYTISVTNFGPSTASGILVTDTLPGGLEFASAVPTTTTNADSQVIWSLGNLAAGGTTNLTLTVISAARGAVTNIATVGAPTLDPSPTNNISQPVISLVTNIPPVANPDSYAISENSGTNIFSPLLNDVVLNPGGTLQLVSVTATNGAAITSGTNVLFVPPPNFIGTLTLLYTITDNVGGTSGSYITVLVTNIPPVANPAIYTVGENSGTATLNPLVNDFPLTPGGMLSLVSLSFTNSTGSISGTNVLFTPATNFFGVATIGYTISDGVGGTATSLITVNVTNVPPVANAQAVNTAENVPVQITLAGSDPNHLPLTFAIVGNPANGTLSGLNPNTGTVTYTPGTNYSGADSFTFHVNNGQTNSASATVNISITPVADLAVTQSGPATGFAGSNLVFTVVVTNLGPSTATSVVVSNQLAAGYTFVSASGGGTDPNNLVIWSFASLPAHSATNFTVTAFATEGGSYTNVASASSAVLDLNPTNNNGSQANAQAVTVLTPVVDLVVYKIGGTNVYAGAPVNYTVIASNAGPSTATSVALQDTLPAGGTFQSASGTYSLSNGVVTWSGFTLAPGAVTTFNITLLASPTVTSFVNIASGSTPAYDPNLTNNNGSYASSRVNTHVTPSADVIASISGPTNAIVGSNMVFELIITNAGPSTASNVVVTDVLLPNLLFMSASGGGTNSNGTNASGTITWPVISALAAGGETNFFVIARALVAGFYTNIVSSTSTTYDPNPTNNTGVLPAAQSQTQVTLPEFTVLQGAPVFNPQDGLYEEQVTVTNSGSTTVAGIQLYVGGLRSGVSLYNAVGTNNGMPFVQYAFPLNPSSTVLFTLEFYDPSRLSFTNTLLVVAYMPTNTVTTGTTNSVAVSTVFEDPRTSPPRIVIEWPSIIGKTYLVIYASSLTATNWYIATPSVTATANITQWYDDGPPKTQSPPLSTTSRFYRVIQY